MIQKGPFIKKTFTASGKKTGVFTCEIGFKLTIDKPVLFMEHAKFRKQLYGFKPRLMKCFIFLIGQGKYLWQFRFENYCYISLFGQDAVVLYIHNW